MLSAIRTSTGDELPGPDGLRNGSIATAAATGTSTSRGTAMFVSAIDAGQPLPIDRDAIIVVRPRRRLVLGGRFAKKATLGARTGAPSHARPCSMHAGKPGPHQPPASGAAAISDAGHVRP